MIDLSWSHILIVLIVALVVVGPKDLPRLMRIVGQWVAKARSMADQFRKSFDEMARQSELDDLRKEIESLRSQRPLADLHATLSQPLLPADPLAPSELPMPDDVPPAAPPHDPAATETTGAFAAEEPRRVSTAP